MRKDTFKLDKSTKRVMALAMKNKTESNAYKAIMVGAQITYENLKTRKPRDRSETAGEYWTWNKQPSGEQDVS